MGFIWDSSNTPKVQRHKIEPHEAEEALADPDRIAGTTYRDTRTGESRTITTGETEDGRLLTVIFTVRSSDLRVITARPADSAEQIDYERGK